MAGWIKFDDAYQCNLSEMVEHQNKNHWPCRCPDCHYWIFTPIGEVSNDWTAWRGKNILQGRPTTYDPKKITHYFKECETCDAQLTVFNDTSST